jgi:hypothetical protein
MKIQMVGYITFKRSTPLFVLYCLVAQVFSTTPLNFMWRRSLIGPKLVAWNELLSRILSNYVEITH